MTDKEQIAKKPLVFVILKELANTAEIKEILEHKWNLRSDPDHTVMWFLCSPIIFLTPPAKRCLECRDHKVYAQWALKYNSDLQVYPEIDDDGEEATKWKELQQQLKQADKHMSREVYPKLFDYTLRNMTNLFLDITLETPLKEVDTILDDFETVVADFDEDQRNKLVEHLRENRENESKSTEFIQKLYDLYFSYRYYNA